MKSKYSAQELYTRHREQRNHYYVPEKPFHYTTDWDGLLCHEREVLAANGHCPKCSSASWTTIEKAGNEKQWLQCDTCEYLVAQTTEETHQCLHKQSNVPTATSGTQATPTPAAGACAAGNTSRTAKQRRDKLTVYELLQRPFKDLTPRQKLRRAEEWWKRLSAEQKQGVYAEKMQDDNRSLLWTTAFRHLRFKKKSNL